MSRLAVELLDAFEALPDDDKQAVAMEILRRAGGLPVDSGPLTDEEIGHASLGVYALLDQEESQR